MNDWFETEVTLDADALAVMVQGMRAVARADGVLHQRELNLIAALEADLPRGARADGPLRSEETRTAYLRSLIMVALADGVISEAEREEVARLAADQGMSEERVEAEVLNVKRRFLSVFAGVDVFRDAVVRVARDLGLPETELDALRQEA